MVTVRGGGARGVLLQGAAAPTSSESTGNLIDDWLTLGRHKPQS